MNTQSSSDARKIRDAAREVLRRFGRMEITGGGRPVRIIRAELGDADGPQYAVHAAAPRFGIYAECLGASWTRNPALLARCGHVDLTRERLIP
jgi:hypothetical protein